MSMYELLLYLHIAAAIVWVGSGFLIQVQAVRANKANDHANLKRILDDVEGLSNTVFIPASLVVVVFGVLMVVDSDAWGFDQLWIVLGLVGYFATFVTGVGVLKPRGEYLAEAMEREGMSDHVVAKMRELRVLARIDFLVLTVVVCTMAVKPSGDDPGVLVGMAAVLVAGTLLFLSQARALRVADGGEAPATG